MIQVRYTSHDDLRELHQCPECKKYWVYCEPCGYLADYAHEAANGRHLYGDHRLIKCAECGEPFWIDDEVITEVCPPCQHWNDHGEYKEWYEPYESEKEN
jgi:hypothetical protein